MPDASKTVVAGGATGRVWIGDPETVTVPTTAADLANIDLEQDGFIDLGYVSDDGITLSNAPNKTDVFAWNAARAIRTLRGEAETKLTFTALEWSPDNLAFAMGGSVADGVFTPTEDDIFWSVVILFQDAGNQYAVVMPRGTVTGEVELALSRTELAGLPVDFKSMPESQEDPDDPLGQAFLIISDDPTWELPLSS